MQTIQLELRLASVNFHFSRFYENSEKLVKMTNAYFSLRFQYIFSEIFVTNILLIKIISIKTQSGKTLHFQIKQKIL